MPTVTGYRKKPAEILFIACLFIFLPVMSLFQYALQVDELKALLSIINSKPFLIELFCSWSAAIALLIVTKTSFVYFMGLSVYAIILKFMHFQPGNLLLSFLDILITLVWFSTAIALFFTTLKTPYLNPKTRWWTQPPRYPHFLGGEMIYEGISFPIVTLNFSETGLFAKLDERVLSEGDKEMASRVYFEERRFREPLSRLHFPPAAVKVAKQNLNLYPFKPGSRAHLKISLKPEAEKVVGSAFFDLDAEIVWTSSEGSAFSYGIGLRFLKPSAEQKRAIKSYLKTFFKGRSRAR